MRAISTPAVSKKSLVLAMILIGQLMIILDASIITTALPTIERSLHFSSASLSWVQNAYTLTFGGLLLLGARAGDILGRRRVFVVGIAGFTLASFAGGIAQTSEWLLVARAIQGMFAAIAAPSTLALLTESFQEPGERARAVALFSSVVGAGASLGLVIGGLLTSWVSWRWGLFINVPIGIALVALAPRYLPETERQTGHFDLVGAITSTIGMALIVYGFVRAASDGWSESGTVASFAVGITAMVAFVVNELRAEQPITPMHLFADRGRSSALFSRMLMVSGMFSMFFFLSQYLQGVLHFSAIKAGLAFLPLTGLMFAMVQVVPKLSKYFSNGQMVAGGVGVAMVGMALLSRVSDTSSYFPELALPMLLVGAGIGTAFIPSTQLILTGVDPHDAGAASGLVNVSQQIGGTLGLATLVSVFESHVRAPSFSPADALAHGVSAVLTGSAIFLALAMITIVAGTYRRATRDAELVHLDPVQLESAEIAS